MSDAVKKALQERYTALHHDPEKKSARGKIPETWCCVDCGVDTAPGCKNRKEVELDLALYGQTQYHVSEFSEVYTVTPEVWAQTGLTGMGGCLCIGCLEQRIGRRLKPEDFQQDHPFMDFPGTKRLLKRRGTRAKMLPWEQ
jgi:hypothetical protein